MRATATNLTAAAAGYEAHETDAVHRFSQLPPWGTVLALMADLAATVASLSQVESASFDYRCRTRRFPARHQPTYNHPPTSQPLLLFTQK